MGPTFGAREVSRHERQGDAPAAVRGRTFARYETIFRLCWVGGAGLATAVPFASRGGMWTLAAIAGTGIVLAVRGLLRGRPVARRDGSTLPCQIGNA